VTWLPALRIACREALRAKGRSVLIVAMVALPVLGIGGTDILFRSAQLDPDERVTRTLGQTQARVASFGGGRVIQPPDPDLDGAASLGGRVRSTVPEPPAGYRVLLSQEGTLTFRTVGGVAPLAVHETDVGDPAFAGKFVVEDGRAPNSEAEVAVTSAALERLGTEVGGTAQVAGSDRSLRVVGIVEESGSRGPETIWALPGTLLTASVSAEVAPTVYLAGTRPVTWEDVLHLNRQGFLVYSRAVVLDPAPRPEVPYYERGFDAGTGQETLITVLAATLVVTLAVLEVVLLAGAAFAVGARRQERSLGLVTAAGGEARDVRRVVMASGVVLGIAGAVLGLVLALVLSVAAMPLLERYADQDFGHFDIRPLELLGAALVGLVAALLASVLPARNAARRDPVEALTGRRGQVRTPRKASAAGVTLVGVGIAVAALGSVLAVSSAAGVHPAGGRSSLLAAGLIAGGAALTQLGLIVCSPAIVGLAGRLSRRLPLPLRLALTDASRHRGRSAPAIAAVLAAVTGATALALVAASFDQRDRENYLAAWPSGTAGVMLEVPSGEGDRLRRIEPERVVAAVRGELPPFEAHEIRSVAGCTRPEGCTSVIPILPKAQQCPAWSSPNLSEAELAAAEQDPRCDPTQTYQGTMLPMTVEGDADLLRVLVGSAPEKAETTLASGGVVVLDRRYVTDGTVKLEVSPADGSRLERVKLPAVALDVRNPPVLALHGEQVTERLGLRMAPTQLLLAFDRLPTAEEEDAARQALRVAGLSIPVTVERGYESDYGLGLLALVGGAALITLGAAGIATGLAQADARADHATLAAVGATPGLRRTLAAAQALAVAGLGTLLGVFAGLVPGLAFIGAVDSLDLALPWFTLIEVLVGIPLVAAACAWLLARSRLPLERRVAI
jgi:putative ABC transport system permease protein